MEKKKRLTSSKMALRLVISRNLYRCQKKHVSIIIRTNIFNTNIQPRMFRINFLLKIYYSSIMRFLFFFLLLLYLLHRYSSWPFPSLSTSTSNPTINLHTKSTTNLTWYFAIFAIFPDIGVRLFIYLKRVWAPVY